MTHGRFPLVLGAQTLAFAAVAALAARESERPAVVLAAAALCWGGAAGLALWEYRRSRIALDRLRRGLRRFRRSDFSDRIALDDDGPLADLAAEANTVATDLGQRFDEFVRQRNQLEAILGSMQEGVLAIDRDERVLGLNRTAETLLDTSGEKAQGRLVHEVIRHAEVQRYIRRHLGTPRNGAEDEGITVEGVRNMVFRVRSAPLRDAEGREIGMLLLLANVTRLNRLETLRRDFAANVSHELRTPVASIKGYAETLLDTPPEDHAATRRFLSVIHRQANRLESLIEDLLSLTSLEGMKQVERQPVRVTELLGEVLEICSRTLREREATVAVECPPDLEAMLSVRLVEQALVNLIENAARYGGPQAQITVRAATEGETLVLSVADKGQGIPAQHHGRLFERFYRVDKARSRQGGGTGLGLAIVKHVAGVHGGTAEVESAPGCGARFTLRLPPAAPIG